MGRPVGEEKQKALVTVSRVVVMIVIIIAFFYFLIVLPPLPRPSCSFCQRWGVSPLSPMPCHPRWLPCSLPPPPPASLARIYVCLYTSCNLVPTRRRLPDDWVRPTGGNAHTHTHTVAFTRGFQLGRIANYRSLTSTGIEWDWKMPGDSGRRQQEKIEEEEEEEEERPLSIRLTRSNECNPNGWFDVADIVNESPRSVSSFPLSFHLLFVNLL